MNKRLFKKILIWTTSILIIAAIGWYFTMDYAINKMLRTISFDDMSAVGEDLVASSEVVESQSPSPDKNSKDSTDHISPSPSASASASVIPNSTFIPRTTSTKSTPTPTPKYVGTITKDKAETAQKNITFKEKSDISMILLKRLSPSDISLFSKMASGGLDIAEKKEAKKEILKKLSEDEYNKLIQIAARLGLSQGESYRDSIIGIPKN